MLPFDIVHTHFVKKAVLLKIAVNSKLAKKGLIKQS